MATERRQVVVVGGGPAGAAVACFLAQARLDVLLLDAARFPREKVCGESVSPGARRLLQRMGAADTLDFRSRALQGMRLVSPDGTEFTGRYPGGRSGFAVRRLELDALLLERARAAGAEVREGVRVSGLLQERGVVTGVVDAQGSTVRACVVIGADGRRSVVARRLGLLREHPRLRRFAVRGHWTGFQGLSAFGEMHVAPGAYCGLAPLRDSVNVAFVVGQREMTAAGGDLEGFYRTELRRRWPALAERAEHARLCAPPAAVGPLALVCRAASAPGAVLVGDASGFHDPFTGEGITLALHAAELAAAALRPVLLGRPSDVVPRLLAYERARSAETRAKFRFNRLLQLAVTHPALANGIARRLHRRPDLAEQMVGIAGDLVDAGSVSRPRFLLDLLRA